MSDDMGLKFDQDKLQYSLMSIHAIEEMLKVLQYGAKKYGARNWEKGLKYSRVIDATYRHLGDYLKGIRIDPETGLPTMAHVMCNIMFLLHYELTNTGEDDLK